jgi:signal peptidase I
MRKKLGKFWREWVKPLLIAVAIVAPLRSVVADWNDVPTGSMRPTILVGDRILVNKLAYDLKVPFSTIRLSTWSDPQRGDIIVFRSPADGKRLVKRVAAVPGEVIEMRNDRLFLNGQPASYEAADAVIGKSALVFHETVAGRTHPVMICPAQRALRSFGPVRVPAGRYFVMGDNRDESFDSRYFGFVSRDVIVGRATTVALSFDREHYWRPRLNRFLQNLL